MKNTVRELREIADEVREFFPTLTDAEAAQIAVQHQANCIQVAAHLISSSELYPAALEAIAMQLSHISGTPIK